MIPAHEIFIKLADADGVETTFLVDSLKIQLVAHSVTGSPMQRFCTDVIELFEATRQAQTEYFEERDGLAKRGKLDRARRLENKVDQLIRDYRRVRLQKASLHMNTAPAPVQTEMFGQ